MNTFKSTKKNVLGYDDKTIRALRANAEANKTPRYIVRCGILENGRAVVHDCLGGWICSTHKNLSLAQKRADELNAAAEVGRTHED